MAESDTSETSTDRYSGPITRSRKATANNYTTVGAHAATATTGSSAPLPMSSRTASVSKKKIFRPAPQENLRMTLTTTDSVVSDTIRDKVLGNPLIVELICSSTESQAELLNLRLVNHLFQEAATKSLRLIHKRIVLKMDTRVKQFLQCIQKRDELRLNPFPFSFFEIHPRSLSLEILETFGATIGPHIEHYKFQHPGGPPEAPEYSLELGRKLTTLLSHSPQLSKLQFHLQYAPYVSDQDLISLPTSFRRLNEIRVSGADYRDGSWEPLPPASPYPLLELLIQRAIHLKNVQIPGSIPTLSLNLVRFLIQNRPNNMPQLSMNGQLVLGSIRSSTYELTGFNFLFATNFFQISVTPQDMNEDEVRTMVRRVATWLETQTNSITDLSLDLEIPPQFTPFAFPSLRVLKDLTIRFCFPPNSQPIFPFIENQFPVLQKLQLYYYKEQFEVLGNSSMPSVQELELCYFHSPMSDPSWVTVFPNITSLCIHFAYASVNFMYPTLQFILTHLTRLIHLQLKLTRPRGESRSHDYWNLLTGGAPRPRPGRQFELSVQALIANAGEAEEPINGIYQVPSLRNMKALKTLSLHPRLYSNLNAILHMSHARFLVPLQKLKLITSGNELKKTKSQMAKYEKILTRVHAEVQVGCGPTEH